MFKLQETRPGLGISQSPVRVTCLESSPKTFKMNFFTKKVHFPFAGNNCRRWGLRWRGPRKTSTQEPSTTCQGTPNTFRKSPIRGNPILFPGIDYSRYFVSHILEFQLHRALCEAAGEYSRGDPSKPLHKCDVYGSRRAGKLLRLVLGFILGFTEIVSSAASSNIVV